MRKTQLQDFLEATFNGLSRNNVVTVGIMENSIHFTNRMTLTQEWYDLNRFKLICIRVRRVIWFCNGIRARLNRTQYT
jgi:hypothetical protein